MYHQEIRHSRKMNIKDGGQGLNNNTHRHTEIKTSQWGWLKLLGSLGYNQI